MPMASDVAIQLLWTPQEQTGIRALVDMTTSVAESFPKFVLILAYSSKGDIQSSYSCICGRICGNNKTSRMDAESVSSMTSLSIPIPSPAVGGRPYSSAVM